MTSVDDDMEKLEPLCDVGGTVYGTTTMENSLEVPREIKNTIATWPSNPTLEYIFKRTENRLPRDICISMNTTALFIIGKMWRQPQGRSKDDG